MSCLAGLLVVTLLAGPVQGEMRSLGWPDWAGDQCSRYLPSHHPHHPAPQLNKQTQMSFSLSSQLLHSELNGQSHVNKTFVNVTSITLVRKTEDFIRQQLLSCTA